MKQSQLNCFAVCPPGLEKICAAELDALGIDSSVQQAGGVEFSAGLRELYLANLWLRTASRVLVRVGELHARDFPGLFRKAVRLPWGRFIKPGRGCTIRVTCHHSRLSHSGRIAETVQAAIDKALGTVSRSEQPEALVVVRLEQDRCQLSVDSSGELLHRRGYRRSTVPAPLRENLAAGILLALGWAGQRTLLDAMTGSGTFAIEAALLAAHRAPGRERRFAFMDWPRYRAGLWQNLLQDADRQALDSLPVRIVGVDLDSRAIAAARQNAAAAGVAGLIDFSIQPMQELSKPAAEGLILCNPPYGERLGKEERLPELFAALGKLYRSEFAAWQAAFLAPNAPLARSTGLTCRQRLLFSNGGLKVRLLERLNRPG